ncbi:MAG: XRE family transcriptional regulator [Bacteroidetes bacterium]|nr:MAG: XRE family transcriptional regulator [Bacteroidota bacterium]
MPGTIIRQLRENKGLKQEQVAQQLGISQAAYSKIENNITKLTVKYCKVLSRVLGVNVYDYFDDDFEIVRHEEVNTEAADTPCDEDAEA